MASKGLGTGLGALFGDSAIDSGASEKTVLPIEKIEPRRDQPRKVFDEDKLLELSQSIKEHGVIQPITVRELDGGYYQIIAGERRWRAARMAKLAEVPVRIVEADDEKAMVLAMVENLQRRDLNPIEEARGYKTLADSYKMTQTQIASAVGKSRPVIANALRLLTLPEEVLKLLDDGKLSHTQARAILEIENEEDRIAAASEACEKELTVREIENLAKKLKKPPRAKEKRPISPDGVDYYAQVEKSLSDILGRKVSVIYGKKRGKIEIEYYGDEDFENICGALSKIEK